MKRIFTHFSLFSLLLVLFGGNLNAQTYVLTIDDPVEVAGSYVLLKSGFGPQTFDNITGGIVIPDAVEACDGDEDNYTGNNPITTDLTGSIAMVNRGSCAFVEKVRYAQDKGAIAVIICNREGEDDFNPGGDDDNGDVTTPSFMMSYTTCEAIKIALAAGSVTATVEPTPCGALVEEIPNAIFGNATGEGDFAGGLNDWTVDNGWEYSPFGDYTGQFIDGTMESATACNGTMVFSSDKLDGDGSCPAPCVGSLFSPNIQLPDTVDGLMIQYDHSARHYYGGMYAVITSYDDGATWPDTFDINTDLIPNGFTRESTKRVPLCDIPSDASQIKIQFHHVGEYYFWGIDDVYLLNIATGDPQTNFNFHAAAQSVMTPASQASDIAFLADIKNNGNITSTNTQLNATVYSLASGDTLYSEGYMYGDVAGCEQIENVDFPELAPMPTDVGQYLIEYDINSDNNGYFDNDLQSSTFYITQNSFSKLINEETFGQEYFSGFLDNYTWQLDNNYSVGSHFYVPNGNGHKLSKVYFGIFESTAPSSFVTVGLYKIITDLNENSDIEANERELVASKDVFLADGHPNLRKIEVDFSIDEDGDPVEIALEDDTDYFVMLSVLPSDENDPNLRILGFDSDDDGFWYRTQYYGATNLAYGNKGIQKWSTLVGDGAENLDERVFQDGWPVEVYVEMEIAELEGVGNVNFDEKINLSVHPNPVQDNMLIDFNLPESSKDVVTQIFNVSGSMVIQKKFSNVKSDKLNLNTSQLPSGMYMVKITTDTGFSSLKFVKE